MPAISTHAAGTLSALSFTRRLAAVTTTAALLNAWSASQHLFAAGGQNCLECFDAVVRCLEEKVLHYGLSTLELRDQHLRVCTAWHFTAHLGHDAIATRAMQNNNDTPFPRLHEIRGFGTLMLGDPRRTATSATSPFPFCHSFGYLPE